MSRKKYSNQDRETRLTWWIWGVFLTPPIFELSESIEEFALVAKSELWGPDVVVWWSVKLESALFAKFDEWGPEVVVWWSVKPELLCPVRLDWPECTLESCVPEVEVSPVRPEEPWVPVWVESWPVVPWFPVRPDEPWVPVWVESWLVVPWWAGLSSPDFNSLLTPRFLSVPCSYSTN